MQSCKHSKSRGPPCSSNAVGTLPEAVQEEGAHTEEVLNDGSSNSTQQYCQFWSVLGHRLVKERVKHSTSCAYKQIRQAGMIAAGEIDVLDDYLLHTWQQHVSVSCLSSSCANLSRVNYIPSECKSLRNASLPQQWAVNGPTHLHLRLMSEPKIFAIRDRTTQFLAWAMRLHVQVDSATQNHLAIYHFHARCRESWRSQTHPTPRLRLGWTIAWEGHS